MQTAIGTRFITFDSQMQLSTNIDASKTYRMLQLTPKLQASLQEGTLSLKRSEAGLVYACTDDCTHLLRNLKQTNTLLISQYTDRKVEVFAAPSSTLESLEMPGSINWSQVPEYLGSTKSNISTLDFSQAMDLACCSPSEFQNECRSRPAIAINGKFYQISPGVVYNVLVYIVSTMVENDDPELQSDLSSLQIDVNEPQEVISAVYQKFRADKGLNIAQIGKWLGIYVLKQHPNGIKKDEFIKKWKYDLPININTDPTSLYGSLIELDGTTYQYLNPKTLPSDPKSLFEKLFSIKNDWIYAEIEPYIAGHVPTGEKLVKWIRKYARTRQVGSEIILTPLNR